MVFQTKKIRNGAVLYDIYDGSLYRNDAYFFGKQHVLELAIYHEDLEVCNPLGSKVGKHKVDMSYYSLINIDPRFRSKHCSVRLVAICNTKFVKNVGQKKFFFQ